MKKIYLKPYVETANMRFNYVICGTTIDGPQPPAQPGSTTPPPMPGKLF